MAVVHILFIAFCGFALAESATISFDQFHWPMPIEVIRDDTKEDVTKYAECMVDCLKRPLAATYIMYIDTVCGTDLECWQNILKKEEVRCVPSCKLKTMGILPFIKVTKDNEGKDNVQEIAATSSAGVASSHTESFIQCFGACLHLSSTTAQKYYHKCGQNLLCWNRYIKDMNELSKCWVQCIPIQQQFEIHPTTDGASGSTESDRARGAVGFVSVGAWDPFIQCFGYCLHLSRATAQMYYKICGQNLACWFRYVKDWYQLNVCYARCHHVQEEPDSKVYQPNRVSARFRFRCVTCLGVTTLTHRHWEGKCGNEAFCWMSKMGEDRIHCLPSCITTISMKKYR